MIQYDFHLLFAISLNLFITCSVNSLECFGQLLKQIVLCMAFQDPRA